jgi:hypothetical protein
VHGVFPNGSDGPWSNIVSFTTPAQAVLNCGESSLPPAQQNFSPLAQATTGMIWQVGQFEMVVTQLNNMSSPNGLYSGLGKMIMPLGVTVACTFTNIQMGVDQVMYAGEVKAITEGVNAWMTQWQLTFNSYEAVYVEINQSVDSVYLNAMGEIVIVNLNGDTTTLSNPSNGNNNTVVTDITGNSWVIGPNGVVIFVSAQISNIIKIALQNINAEYADIMQNQEEAINQSLDVLNTIGDTLSVIPTDIDFGIISADTLISTSIPSSEITYANANKNRKSNSIGYFTQGTLGVLSTNCLANQTWPELGLMPISNSTLLAQLQLKINAGFSQSQLIDFCEESVVNYVNELSYKFMYSK